MKRLLSLSLLAAFFLLPACGSTTPPSASSPIQTTELRAGSQLCNVDVVLTGDLSPDDGPYLTFQVQNNGEHELTLSFDKDLENGVPVPPGESASITKELDAFDRTYLCSANPPNTGGDVNVTYTLTQSTTPPAE